MTQACANGTFNEDYYNGPSYLLSGLDLRAMEEMSLS